MNKRKLANVNVQADQVRGTPTLPAPLKSHLTNVMRNMVQYVLESKTDPSARGAAYDFALMAAAYEVHFEVVHTLPHHGADEFSG